MQALRKRMTLEEIENDKEDKKKRMKICRASKSIEDNNYEKYIEKHRIRKHRKGFQERNI